MKILCSIVATLTLMLVLVFSPAVAQEDNGALWHWAFDPLTGDVYAFDAAGQVQTLASTEVTQLRAGWRTTPSQAFMVVEDMQRNSQLLRLTPNAIDNIDLHEATEWRGVQELIVNTNASVLINIRPYNVNGVMVTSMLILNNETLATLLVEHVAYRAALFSENEQSIYYARIDEQTITLARTQIDTLETEDIFIFPVGTITINGTQGHDYFYYNTRNAETNENAFYRVGFDGKSELLSANSTEIISPILQTQNAFAVVDVECRLDCAVRVNTHEDETLEFHFSELNGILNPLRLYSDEEVNYLLVHIADNFVLVGTDGSEMQLGEFSPLTGLSLGQVIFANGRFLFTVDEESAMYRVWDLQEIAVVMENDKPRNPIFSVRFSTTSASFILSEELQRYYLYRDGEIFNLPKLADVHYYDILPNGNILAAQLHTNQEMARGAYSYNMESGNFSLLVEDAIPIYLREF